MSCCKCEEYGWKDLEEVVYIDAEGQGYCVFHAPYKQKRCSPEGKKIHIDDFNNLIFDKIRNFSVEDDKECTLKGTIFPGKIAFKSYSSFPHISFSGSSFQKLIFENVVFEGRIGFANVKFNHKITFRNCIFHRPVVFDQSEFINGAKFVKVEFSDFVNFNKVKFKEKTSFSSALFSSYGDFYDINQDDESNIRFTNCYASYSGVNFRNCKNLNVDLTKQYELRYFRFINSSFEISGHIKAGTEGTSPQPTRDFYQRMKAKYKDENNEYEASKWHVAEKEAQLKLLGQSEGERFNYSMLWLYRAVSGFGEDPLRALRVLVGLLVLPLLFLLIGSAASVEISFGAWVYTSDPQTDVIAEWLKYFPLAKAMHADTGAAWRLLMLGWQLLITIQAALFAFALRNNFRR